MHHLSSTVKISHMLVNNDTDLPKCVKTAENGGWLSKGGLGQAMSFRFNQTLRFNLCPLWHTQIQSVQGIDATWPVFKFQRTSPLNLQALSNWVSGGLWATTTAANTVFHIAWFVVKAALRSDWVNTESLRYAVSALCWDMTHSPWRQNLFPSAYVDR